MNATKIGQRVRAKRISAGQTQAQLAQAVGVHKNTIGALERGEAEALGMRTLFVIARVLQVKPSWFLS